ncbi:hypothetical protein MNEG_3617 [Monoraphidium neglectum]|uniref:Uncharacterized protein n=1 Tax=Monoraphidium neglectum TaxID=145388 RepID=A0A0D2MNR2_9CHLO|nr:hypothetical protein MNEG_3617 [Monoraphidium neglectum]KIZ04340.1 hypothetical protein MNEG_3617 [Monoraphidium neglectum]|eukprot:XP_013903359.1 hypothetical protein MNEG_3617 [Monoraphidium neglectum]
MSRSKEEGAAADAPSTSGSTSSAEVDVDAALARRRSRRRIQPAVKVESAAVAQATGAAPQTPVGEFETAVVQLLGGFFALLLAEGLLLAASGFLPEDWDQFIENVLYPSFSPQMLAFLGASSFYGLWKTGKLPGQKQM